MPALLTTFYVIETKEVSCGLISDLVDTMIIDLHVQKSSTGMLAKRASYSIIMQCILIKEIYIANVKLSFAGHAMGSSGQHICLVCRLFQN